MQNYLLPLCLFFGISGCSTDNEPLALYQLPVIAECEHELVEFVNYGKFSNYLKGEVIYFSDPLPRWHLPNLVGYMQLELVNTTDKNPEEFLESLINNVILSCYPTDSSSIEKGNLGSKLKSLLEFNGRLGIKENYLVLDENELLIYSSGPFKKEKHSTK